MRFHVVSLPHTETTRDFDWCAYTAKVRRFSTMMRSLGHEVILYAGDRNEAACTEHVTIVTEADWERWWPEGLNRTHVWDGFQVEAPWWREMNERAIEAVAIKEPKPGDIICLIAGICQEPIARAFPELRTVEWGVGYSGVFADFRVYESYAWRHYLAGRGGYDDVRYYDAVIPNSFEKSEFSFTTAPDDYLLYIGRMTPRKGLAVVQEIANRGHRVITAGQGSERIAGAEHVGVVLGGTKKELFAKAKAVLVPTTYLEPFGGVAVEAMLSGAPVITTDWGAFTETVNHGLSGFRCSTLGEFLGAVDRVDMLDRYEVREYARSRYLTTVVAKQYDAYFAQVNQLRRAGWYTDQGRLRAGIFARHLH